INQAWVHNIVHRYYLDQHRADLLAAPTNYKQLLSDKIFYLNGVYSILVYDQNAPSLDKYVVANYNCQSLRDLQTILFQDFLDKRDQVFNNNSTVLP
ncbi:hypothetical protein, partial [Escherichia coli]|uniref:hypothetical protein n=1 Tax=Escherichia coli TaxID=562 RepID=UPI00307A468F